MGDTEGERVGAFEGDTEGESVGCSIGYGDEKRSKENDVSSAYLKTVKKKIQLTLIVGFLEGEKVGGDTGRGVGLAVMGFDVCGGSVQPPLPPFTQTQ